MPESIDSDFILKVLELVQSPLTWTVVMAYFGLSMINHVLDLAKKSMLGFRHFRAGNEDVVSDNYVGPERRAECKVGDSLNDDAAGGYRIAKENASKLEEILQATRDSAMATERTAMHQENMANILRDVVREQQAGNHSQTTLAREVSDLAKEIARN